MKTLTFPTSLQQASAIPHHSSRLDWTQSDDISPLGRRLEDTVGFPWQNNDLLMLDHMLVQMYANGLSTQEHDKSQTIC